MDVYNPKVVQASMGSISRVRVGYTDILSLLEENKEIPIYAAVLHGKDIMPMESDRFIDSLIDLVLCRSESSF